MTLGELCRLASWSLVRDAEIDSLGFFDIPLERRLVFATDARRARAALAAPGVAALVVPPECRAELEGGSLGLALADDPLGSFVTLHNHLADRTDFYGFAEPTEIDPSAKIDPSAFVDPIGVRIGPHSSVAPRAVVLRGTRAGADVRVMPGAVLGSEAFQIFFRTAGALELRHAGGIEIGDGAVIMANAVVARAVFRQATRVGAETRLGNCAFVSHNVQIGERCLIGHGAVVAGNAQLGDEVVMGPGSICLDRIALGDRAIVTAGSVAFRSVEAGARVTGNLAIDHQRFLRALAEKDEFVSASERG